MPAEFRQLSRRPPLLTEVPGDWGSGNASSQATAHSKVFALLPWGGESSQSPAPGPWQWGLEILKLTYLDNNEPPGTAWSAQRSRTLRESDLSQVTSLGGRMEGQFQGLIQ